MFADTLRNYRTKKKLTQVEMITMIISIDKIFSGLDEVTYSRWENNHSCPSILKRCKILRRINQFEELKSMLSSHTDGCYKFLHLIDARFNHGYAGSEYAYNRLDECFSFRYFNAIPDDFYDEFKLFQSNIFGHDINYDAMCNMVSRSNTFHCYIIKDSQQRLVGHLVFLDVSIKVIKEVFFNALSENFKYTLGDDERVVFILSEYSIRKEVALFKFKIIKDYLINHNIKKYYARVFHPELVFFHKKLGSSVIIKSKKSNEFGKIKYLGEMYQWLGFLGDVDNFLTSDLSGNAEEYTKNFNFLRVD